MNKLQASNQIYNTDLWSVCMNLFNALVWKYLLQKKTRNKKQIHWLFPYGFPDRLIEYISIVVNENNDRGTMLSNFSRLLKSRTTGEVFSDGSEIILCIVMDNYSME